MRQETIIKLSKLHIFETISVPKEEYKNNSNNSRYIYVSAWDYGKADDNYRRIDTQNLTDEEINTLLNIDKANSLRSIKKGVIFFVVLSVISIIISIIGAVNMASLF